MTALAIGAHQLQHAYLFALMLGDTTIGSRGAGAHERDPRHARKLLANRSSAEHPDMLPLTRGSLAKYSRHCSGTAFGSVR